MRTRIPDIAAHLVVASVLATEGLAAGEQAETRRVRTIVFTGERISTMLRPDDQIVEIAPIPGHQGGDFEESAAKLFEGAVRRRVVTVLRMHVTGVSGVLSSEGTFVSTKLVGSIRELIAVGKHPDARTNLVEGRAVEVSVPGGEVSIGGVVVRSQRLVQYPYPAEYVVVLDHLQSENGWAVGLSPPLLVKGDTVGPVVPARSLLDGLGLSEMRKIARAVR